MAQPSSSITSDGRPSFPSGWEALDITLDELNLAHTLPVGQTFLWHRQPIRKDVDPSSLSTSSDTKSNIKILENPAATTETVRTVAQTTTLLNESTHDGEVKIEEIKEEVTVTVKTEEQDPSARPFGTQENLKEEKETTNSEAEPLEEWSRAIYDPPRVIFLRQTPTKIYYTSILPPTTESLNPSFTADVCTIGNPDIDRAYLVDLFNIELTVPFGSLNDIYGSWAEQDRSLFGKAMKARAVPQGVRVLRQDPWECLIEFITSSANNVPRITSLVHRLCYHFSPLLLTLPAPGYATHSETEGDIVPYISYHLFPRPTDLLRGSKPVGQAETSTDVADGSLIDRLQQTLRELGFGYRAGFISSSLQTLVAAHGTPEERSLLGLPRDLDDPQMDEGGVEGFLLSLRQGHESSVGVTSVENKYAQRWRTELLRLKGVGRKVADCIGLMSLDQANVVPIDTHLQQIAARHPRFPAKLKSKATSTEAVYNTVQTFLCDLWGGGPEDNANPTGTRSRMELAGWCQSVMFAADLKGSTAVVNVKVEVSTEEDTLLKLEPAEEPSSLVDSESKPLDRKQRRRRTVLQLETPDTVSVISDLVPDDKLLLVGQSGTAAPLLGLKTESTTFERKRKRVSTPGTVTAKQEGQSVKRVRGPHEAKAKPNQTSRGTGTTTQLAIPVSQGMTAGAVSKACQRTQRTERYASRCNKLEVEIAEDT